MQNLEDYQHIPLSNSELLL